MEVTLIGMGLGDPTTLTAQAVRALEGADGLIGARRLVEGLNLGREVPRYPATKGTEILEILCRSGLERPCVLYSGDTGFYSGARSLTALLEKEGIPFRVLPGLSSVQYLAARLGRPWQDWKLVSAHGTRCDPVAAVLEGREAFFLTGGELGPGELCQALRDAGLGHLRAVVGEELSYPAERITRGTAAEFAQGTFAPLSVLLVEGAERPRAAVSSGIPDEDFLRDEVPMTKREVRAAALSLLEVEEDDVLWDVGGGHGLGLGGAGPPGPAGAGVRRGAEGGGPLPDLRQPDALRRLEPGAGPGDRARRAGGPARPGRRLCGGQRRGAGRHPGRGPGKKSPGPPVRQRHRPGDPVRCCGGLCRPGAGGPGDPDLGGPVQGGRWAEPDDGAESGVAHLRPPEGGGGMRELEHSRPADIEAESFRIIGAELEERGIVLPADQAPLVKRAIHTTADFDYARNLVFTPGAVEAGVRALRAGTPILTDTNMARSGINRGALERLGISVHCFMADPEVARRAAEAGTTRAAAAVDQGAALWREGIYAVGNAPTALIRMAQLIRAGAMSPALILAVPVGFVNVVESKEEILALARERGIPAIAALGRKGGSTVAAALCNALLYQSGGREKL